MDGAYPDEIRVLGIDPGLTRTGWGIVGLRGGKLRAIAHGAIAPEGAGLAQRLADLHRGVSTVILHHQPGCAAIEKTFVNKDAVGAMKLAQARAVALCAAAMAGLEITDYAPNSVKKAVVGVGHADKAQIQHMVGLLLPGVKPASHDAADALAIAICHAWRAETEARIAARGGGQA